MYGLLANAHGVSNTFILAPTPSATIDIINATRGRDEIIAGSDIVTFCDQMRRLQQRHPEAICWNITGASVGGNL